jgi:hypothetical protein
MLSAHSYESQFSLPDRQDEQDKQDFFRPVNPDNSVNPGAPTSSTFDVRRLDRVATMLAPLFARRYESRLHGKDPHQKHRQGHRAPHARDRGHAAF